MIRRVTFKIVLFLLVILSFHPVWATHQKAAEMMVEHVSGYTYRVILITYTYTQSSVDRPQLEVFWGDGNSSVLDRTKEQILSNDTKMNYYTGEHTYAGPGRYQLYMEDPNRNSGVINVPNSVLTPMYVSTTILISPWLEGNSTPVTTRSPVDDNACLGQLYVHNPAVYDPDGDSVSYRLIPCRTGGGEPVPGYTYPAASDTFYIDGYRGDLVWKNPLAQGEYNVAFLIEEWRDGIKIGDVTRDMQIIVRTCSNQPPYIESLEEICIEEGQELKFPIWVRDQNQNHLSLEADGEVMNGNYSAGVNLLGYQPDSAVFEFFWKTSPGDARLNPYQLYLRAFDNGDPVLSGVKTIMIHVLASPPEWGRVEALPQGVELHWRSVSNPDVSGYALYRRDFLASEVEVDSCTRGTGDTSYRFIASLPASDTSFLDTDVIQGRDYCYKVVATFPDRSESKASVPVCVQAYNDAPLPVRASVLTTSAENGSIEVCWVRPKNYDIDKEDDYFYRLFGGILSESMVQLGEFPFDSSICFVDTSLNTENYRYAYMVQLDTVGGSSQGGSPFSSDTVYSMFLRSQDRIRRVDLSWEDETPWKTLRYDIFRRELDEALPGKWGLEDGWEHVGSVGSGQYAFSDTSAVPSVRYEYCVRSVGMYGSALPSDTLYNLSNQVQGSAWLGSPCKPYLFLADSRCEPLQYTLVWDYDSLYDPSLGYAGTPSMSMDEKDDCESAVSHYDVYRRISSEDEFEWIASVEDKRYEDKEAESLFCEYQIEAVGISQEVVPSNIVSVSNWDCFEFDLPNVFTPNGDGVNEVWRARNFTPVQKFSLQVVNRWGVKVYSASSPDFEWNGKLQGNGTDCPDGPYFYMAEFEAVWDGKTFRRILTGSVTILR